MTILLILPTLTAISAVLANFGVFLGGVAAVGILAFQVMKWVHKTFMHLRLRTGVRPN